MKIHFKKRAVASLATSCVFAAGSAGAADLTMLCAGAMKGPMAQLLAARPDSLPHVAVTYATAGQIREKLDKGEVPDIVVAPSDFVFGLMKEQKIDLVTRRGLGTTEVGVAVKAGASLPDIGSMETLRATLLAAKRVVIVDPASGTSGRLAESLFRELGIADQMAPKLLKLPGGNVLEAVARGDADLGLQQISEILPVQGVTLVGALPGEFKRLTRYDVAMMAGAAHPDEARQLLRELDSREARALVQKNGFMPAN